MSEPAHGPSYQELQHEISVLRAQLATATSERDRLKAALEEIVDGLSTIHSIPSISWTKERAQQALKGMP